MDAQGKLVLVGIGVNGLTYHAIFGAAGMLEAGWILGAG
jgi:hypothetical protein